MNDLRYALRSLLRAPGFTTVAVLTLALGIGATTAIFSVFDAVMLKNLPVKNPDELYVVGPGHYRLFQTLQRDGTVFSDVLASAGIEQLDVVVDGGEREKARVSMVSASYFSTLGVPALVGRLFDSGDERPAGEPAIAVVSHAYWQQRLARDPDIVGRIVRVRGTPLTIVGVASAGFHGEEVEASPDLWVPLTMWAQIVPGRNLLESPGTSWLRIIGRLNPGVPVANANAALTVTFRRVLEDIFGPDMRPEARRDVETATVQLRSVARGVSPLRGRFARPLELLMSAVVLVLIISCANVANLSLSRMAARRREVDLQLALGIGRLRLFRQMLAESLVLSVGGGTIGLAMAWAGREGLLRLISADGSRLPVAAETDLRLVMFTAGVSIATAVLFGTVPAWRSARASVAASLATRNAVVDRRTQWLGPALVVAQVAVSLVLLMGAGLFLRTLENLRSVDLGFAPARLLMIDVNPRAAGYSADQAISVTHRVLDRLSAVPGVSTASFSENGVMFGRDSSTNLIRPDGFAGGPGGFPRAQWDIVGPNYFSTMGISLVAGRDFTARDDESSPRVVAINDAMSKRFFNGSSPIGRRLVWGDEKQTDFEVIAVVRDVKQSGPRDEPQLRFYFPYTQIRKTRPSWELASVQFLVRTAADPAAMSRSLQSAIKAGDPRLSTDGVTIGADLLDRTLVQERMIATLSAAFGIVGVGLACIGLYGLIGYHVAQRTNEIGIRMALGAQRSQILWATLGRALTWTIGGLALGVPLAVSVSRLAETLLFGLSATDMTTLAGAGLLMFVCSAVAAYLPARRAARIDPLAALRYD